MSKAQKDPENNINTFLNEGHIERMEQYVEANLGIGVRCIIYIYKTIYIRLYFLQFVTQTYNIGTNLLSCWLDRSLGPLLVVAKQDDEQKSCENMVFP